MNLRFDVSLAPMFQFVTFDGGDLEMAKVSGGLSSVASSRYWTGFRRGAPAGYSHGNGEVLGYTVRLRLIGFRGP